MINIQNKEDCCGCSACVQRCPKNCITMHEDTEGFLYPKVDTALCIKCGLCERVCPVINNGNIRKPLQVFAGINKNEQVRLQSSSGGIFTMLAEWVIEQGGVVFGARWNENWEVVHDFIEKKEDLYVFRSSKYLQSKIGQTFKQAEFFLKHNREVLFVGTPCQIAGFKKYLLKDYDNLLAVDIFCHSVPSPLIWQEYLDELLRKINWNRQDIANINFRDKSKSWKNYHFVMKRKNGEIFDESASKNFFMRGFLNDLYSRPSCRVCPAKSLRSGSDITIGDFWGIQLYKPEIDDDKGVSAIVVNTEKGGRILKYLDFDNKEMLYNELCHVNRAIIVSSVENSKRADFFSDKTVSLFRRIDKYCHISLLSRIKSKILRKIRLL